MIYTLTLNPSIDYIIKTNSLEKGKVNRSLDTSFVAGGKGVNVSRELERNGIKNTSLCLCGTDGECERFKTLVHLDGINCDIIPVCGADVRINVKVFDKDSVVTEINGDNYSFNPTDKIINEITKDIYRALSPIKKGDIIIIGGSLPPWLSCEFYRGIVLILSKKGVNIIADVSGKSLRELVFGSKHPPFMVKPNLDELGELFGVKIKTVDDVFYYGQKLNCSSLISMGGLGAVFIDAKNKDKVYYRKPNSVLKGYTVGAGDALLAGFIAGCIGCGGGFGCGDYTIPLESGISCAENHIRKNIF